MAKTVDDYIEEKSHWSGELSTLREIITSLPFEETVKWGAPCYMAHGQNTIMLGAFKNHFALWFFDARGISDEAGHLTTAKGGKSEMTKQWRFESAAEIKPRIIKKYLKQAYDLAGVEKPKAKPKKIEVEIPPALEAAFKADKKFKTAFDGLTPGRRKEYAEHIESAKRDATKQSRLEKIKPMVLRGVGLNDHYRDKC